MKEKKKSCIVRQKKKKKGFGMRAQLADPDGKARKWRSSDCAALPAGCGMAREQVERKKKTKKEKKKCKLCKPCESVTRPVETNGHRKSSETKLPSGPLFAPRDPARLVCLLLRRNCNIFVAARPSLPRPSMTPIHPPRAGQPTPREPPCLAIPRSVAVSTIHFAEGGRRLC